MTMDHSDTFFVESGSITSDQLDTALEQQGKFSKILLGEVLVQLKMVDQIALDRALEEQIREVSQTGLVHRRMLGEVMVDLNCITEEQLTFALDEQRRLKGLNLGGVLVELELLTVQQLDDLITSQIKATAVSVA